MKREREQKRGLRVARRIKDMLRNTLGIEIKRQTKSPWEKLFIESQQRGFKDTNDFVELGMDNFASKLMKKFFSYDISKLKSGKILEIGAGAGRFTREIAKYVSENVTVVSLEIDPYGYKLLKKNVNKYNNVTPIKGDFFNNDFAEGYFNLILLPWFDHPKTLYNHAMIFKEASLICRETGFFMFDFFDSQDNLIEKISLKSNAPYPFINGGDLELIGNHYGFSKYSEFNVHYNEQVSKIHIWEKI